MATKNTDKKVKNPLAGMKKAKGRSTSKRSGRQKSSEEKGHKRKLFIPLALAAIISVFAARFGNIGFGGFGNGFGFFPGGSSGTGSERSLEQDNTNQETAELEEVAEKTDEQSETTVEIRFVEVTINEDGYIYQNTKQELTDILDDLSEGDIIKLKIHRASKKDVDELTNRAKEKGISVTYDR